MRRRHGGKLMHAILLALSALSMGAEPVDLSPDIFVVEGRDFQMPLALNVSEASVEKIRLFVSTDLGKTWKPAGEFPPTAAKVGFKAPGDGVYYCAVQVMYKDCKAEPRDKAGLAVARKVRVSSLALGTARVSFKPAVSLKAALVEPARANVAMTYVEYVISGFRVHFNGE